MVEEGYLRLLLEGGSRCCMRELEEGSERCEGLHVRSLQLT